MAEVMEVTVPDIGDFEDVPIIEVLVSPGDTVAEEDPLVTLESDKATMDVPSPVAGVVQDLKVSVGDKVAQGKPLLTVAVNGAEPGRSESPPEAASPRAVDTATEAEAEAGTEPPAPVKPAAMPDIPYASPAVRRLARERGIDLSTINGTGRKGRITKEDLDAAQQQPAAPAAAPQPAAAAAGEDAEERVPLSRIKKIAGPRLQQSWQTAPHVTQHDDADITDLEAFRKEVNASQKDVKVTMVALLIKAVVPSLKAFPEVNSSLDGEELILKRYYNIGFAADTPQGLLVPVIKHADRKGILEIAGELTELSGAAREGKLKAEDMRGATFTISSLGGIGGTYFTPIINQPEVAILGVSRSAMKPVWDGAQFVPRLILPLSLSYDHRVIDGALAARFTTHLSGVLSDLKKALL